MTARDARTARPSQPSSPDATRPLLDLFPRGIDLGFGTPGRARLALVKQAEGERALAVALRRDRELPEHRAGDDGVLVLAEDLLKGLRRLPEPPRRSAERGGDGLGGVAQPLRGLACLVQLQLP